MNEPDNENRTTQTGTVGSPLPGSGRGTGIPRGVEVLLKKAAVDDEFRELLLAERASAASAIGLELDPAERAMLEAIPRAQLENIVARTVVPVEQRRVFLGRLAAPMLAVLGIGVTGCFPTRGIQPDTVILPVLPDPPAAAPAGIPSDAPRANSPPAAAPGTVPRPAITVERTRGVRPDRPASDSPPADAQPTASAPTNSPPAPTTQGTRPARLEGF